MKKTIEVKALTEWKDITLKKYLDMMSDIESYKDDDNAVNAMMLHHLAGIPFESINKISKESYDELSTKLSKFLKPEEMELQRFVTIDGIEYGFEPNLSKMTYGAYADVSQYDTLSIDKNWSKIMAILYRPVVQKYKSGQYSIQSYKGEVEHERWLDITMDVHFGCLFFFINLLTDLLKDTLNSTMEMELPPNIKQILVKSGSHIKQFMNLQTEILKK
jgi:hypothetical protein